MNLVKVCSSSVDSIGWENDILVIRFLNGAVYIYSKVPYAVYKEIADAPSVGHAVNEILKKNAGAYPFTRLDRI